MPARGSLRANGGWGWEKVAGGGGDRGVKPERKSPGGGPPDGGSDKREYFLVLQDRIQTRKTEKKPS